MSSHGAFKALTKENMEDLVGISIVQEIESTSEASIKKHISTIQRFSPNF